MIVFVSIIQILMFHKVISFSHRLPVVCVGSQFICKCDFIWYWFPYSADIEDTTSGLCHQISVCALLFGIVGSGGSFSMHVESKSGVWSNSVLRGMGFNWLSHQGPPTSRTQYCFTCFAILGCGPEFFEIFTNYITYNALGDFYNIILSSHFVLHFMCSH